MFRVHEKYGQATEMDITEKVLSLESLPVWRRQVTQTGLLAIVTGTFDLIHPGNLYAIRCARTLAENVLVVVEPDEVASRHCGPSRPQNHLETRVEMVAHLRDVIRVASVTPGEIKDILPGLAPFIWVTAKSGMERDPYWPVLGSGVGRVEAIPSLKGCFSREIIQAIEQHRTPISLPGEWSEFPPRQSPLNKTGGGALVTVNGCFDILHVGHLRFLEEARTMGDSLTVLINSDASVAKYKGPTRPVFPELFRKAALKSLAAVDEVMIFPQDNPLEAIQRLSPRIHVKGGSYESDRVKQERELLESWGGRLVCTPMVEGFSTTHYIKKALQGLREDVV